MQEVENSHLEHVEEQPQRHGPLRLLHGSAHSSSDTDSANSQSREPWVNP